MSPDSVPTAETSRASRSWLILLLPLLALVLALSLGYLWNEDFWWYVSSGRAILQEGGIPSEDPFLYTSGDGIGWVYHSWLWTVVVAGLEGLGGLESVVVLHGLLAAALVVLLFTTARIDRLGLVNALLVVMVLATLRHRVCGKAELVTWLMLVVFYRLLERPGPWTWRWVALLGALEVLWANLHGGYPLGVFLVLCYSVGGWAQRRWQLPLRGESRSLRGTDRSWPPLWLPVLLFLLALAGPGHLRDRLAPYGFVLGSEQVQPTGKSGALLITEWRSPFDGSLPDPTLPWLFALAAAVGVLSFRRARQWHLPRLLFLLGMIALGASAIRHLGGLALAAALVALSNLSDRRSGPAEGPAGGRNAKHGRTRRRAGKARMAPSWSYPAACVVLASLLLGSTAGLWIARPGFDGGQGGSFFAVKPSTTAPGAVDYLLRHRPPGPLFNDYPLGAYLAARLYPAYRVFVDSRVLDPEVVVRYTRMTQSPTEWRRAEAEHGFRIAVLAHFSQTIRSPLGRTLLEDPRWRLAHVDPLAVVFLEDAAGELAGPVQEELYLPSEGAEQGAAPGRVPFVRSPALFPPLRSLQRIFLNDYPTNYLVELLANLGQLGRSKEVVELATWALETMPGHALLLRQRCAAYLVRGRVESALEDCGAAFDARPEDGQIAALYAMVLDRAGKRRQATVVVEDALERHPSDPALRNLRRRLSGR